MPIHMTTTPHVRKTSKSVGDYDQRVHKGVVSLARTPVLEIVMQGVRLGRYILGKRARMERPSQAPCPPMVMLFGIRRVLLEREFYCIG
jgi:hypothetical protein